MTQPNDVLSLFIGEIEKIAAPAGLAGRLAELRRGPAVHHDDRTVLNRSIMAYRGPTKSEPIQDVSANTLGERQFQYMRVTAPRARPGVFVIEALDSDSATAVASSGPVTVQSDRIEPEDPHLYAALVQHVAKWAMDALLRAP